MSASPSRSIRPKRKALEPCARSASRRSAPCPACSPARPCLPRSGHRVDAPARDRRRPWARARPAPQAAGPGRHVDHRRGFRQGRRRQVDHRHQSRHGPGRDRPARGPARRRHLRPFAAAHGRHRRASRAPPTARSCGRWRAHGVKVMSMGFLVDEDAPMIWRGPMVQSALQQMLGDVALGRARRPGRRHAAWHRRRPAHHGAEGAAGRCRDREHAAGHRPARCPEGHQHVPQGRRAGARHRREHVLLLLPELRPPYRDFRPWRRARLRGEVRRRLPGRDPARPRGARNQRCRPPDRGQRAPTIRSRRPIAGWR